MSPVPAASPDQDVIMNSFFDIEFLGNYLGKKLKDFGAGVDTTAQVTAQPSAAR